MIQSIWKEIIAMNINYKWGFYIGNRLVLIDAQLNTDVEYYKKLRLETVVALLKEINRTGKFIMSEQLYQDP